MAALSGAPHRPTPPCPSPCTVSANQPAGRPQPSPAQQPKHAKRMPDPRLYITLPRTTPACMFIVCARKRRDGRCATPVVCLPPPAPSAAPSLPPPPTHLSVICPLPDRTRRPPPTPFSTPPCVTFLWRCSALHQPLTHDHHALHCPFPLFCPPPWPPLLSLPRCHSTSFACVTSTPGQQRQQHWV